LTEVKAGMGQLADLSLWAGFARRAHMGKGSRKQEVYLPAGQQWRDAWHPDKTYQGGQTVTVDAELYQIPLFVRVGSTVNLGDLNHEYQESLAIAQKKPDLKALDAEVAQWFAKKKAGDS